MKPKILYPKWNPCGPYGHPKRGLHPNAIAALLALSKSAMVAPIATDANERIQRIQAQMHMEILAVDNTPYKISKSEKIHTHL